MYSALAPSNPAPPTPYPATILAGATYDTGIIPVRAPGLTATVKMDKAGNLRVLRYFDLAGTILIDTTTQAIVANTQETITLADGVPYRAYKVTVENTAITVATVANIGILTGG